MGECVYGQDVEHGQYVLVSSIREEVQKDNFRTSFFVLSHGDSNLDRQNQNL